MTAGSISEEEFLASVHNFLKVSADNVDVWQLHKVPGHENLSYLQRKFCQLLKTQKKEENRSVSWECKEMDLEDSNSVTLAATDENDITCDYHVVYSQSYAVPVLYFNMYWKDGSLLGLDEVWSLIPCHYRDRFLAERWTFITQQEHPIVHRPYFYLHPCHTADLMKNIELKDKRNYILSWLSAVGPVVRLELPLSYGLSFEPSD
ncbi:ubiquitin-like-conjugating enzyme ATG10 isoform X2 [Octopus bimaculoides]|uniref:ubiquitin-like-conjugating enzyme ATG10 isoform X2 n=1 Tax=Octopus bimaculoides TaxID=37653 RepID=UPI00071E2EA4|nr:ubiquitin-like-conjugating enzyme ATG10 isoform X2 [Octopus bimaculoides]|eukprot:XP_014777851.1 PREDICTED: ubiquitin-like-conjugating enzyme ATG10 [Octopus bimaculoides]